MLLKGGQQIHYLTVIRLHHQDKRWRRHWLCKCRCGTEKVIQGSLLISGNTKSCGCWAKEAARLRALPHGQASRNQVLAGYRHKAKKAKSGFSLTAEQFGRIATQPCFYCGTRPSNVHRSQNGTGDFVYSGIDKIDPRKGYSVANTVPCCHICNFAKSNNSQGSFMDWIKRAHDHLRKTAMAEQWG